MAEAERPRKRKERKEGKERTEGREGRQPAAVREVELAKVGSSRREGERAAGAAAFRALGLEEALVEAVGSLGWTAPTEIQRQAVPLALRGQDIIGLAQTGSGKTGAFALPILQELLEKPQPLFALVMSPTRELALQIAEQFEALGAGIGLRCAVLVGGIDIMAQAIALGKRPHVVVGTPGRVDHLQNTKQRPTPPQWGLEPAPAPGATAPAPGGPQDAAGLGRPGDGGPALRPAPAEGAAEEGDAEEAGAAEAGAGEDEGHQEGHPGEVEGAGEEVQAGEEEAGEDGAGEEGGPAQGHVRAHARQGRDVHALASTQEEEGTVTTPGAEDGVDPGVDAKVDDLG